MEAMNGDASLHLPIAPTVAPSSLYRDPGQLVLVKLYGTDGKGPNIYNEVYIGERFDVNYNGNKIYIAVCGKDPC